VVGTEYFPDDVGALLEDDHHEGAHQVAGVRLFVEFIRTVVEYFHIFIKGVLTGYKGKVLIINELTRGCICGS
jgi:hypothetical protein